MGRAGVGLVTAAAAVAALVPTAAAATGASEHASADASPGRHGVVRDGEAHVSVKYRCTIPDHADEHTVEVLTELRQWRWRTGLASDYDYDVDEFRCDGRRHWLMHRFTSETATQFRVGPAKLLARVTVCWDDWETGADGCVSTDATRWIKIHRGGKPAPPYV